MIDGSLWRSRLAAWLLSALGTVAEVVALVGVHALVGTIVRSRMRELGIRAALRASGSALGASVARSIAPLAVLSIGGGVGVTTLLSGPVHLLLPAAASLTGPSVVAAIVLLLAGALACAPAARRAAWVDPAALLRR